MYFIAGVLCVRSHVERVFQPLQSNVSGDNPIFSRQYLSQKSPAARLPGRVASARHGPQDGHAADGPRDRAGDPQARHPHGIHRPRAGPSGGEGRPQ